MFKSLKKMIYNFGGGRDPAGLRREYMKWREEEGLPYRCEMPDCPLYQMNPAKWKGEKITLQIDHISGYHEDSTPQNLRLVCPNCHSQTSTFAGGNRNTVSNANTVGYQYRDDLGNQNVKIIPKEMEFKGDILPPEKP